MPFLASKLWLFLLVAAALFAAAPKPAVEAIFAPLIDPKSPGAAVLVRKNGRTIFARGYGLSRSPNPSCYRRAYEFSLGLVYQTIYGHGHYAARARRQTFL